jgi:hypothetical protein
MTAESPSIPFERPKPVVSNKPPIPDKTGFEMASSLEEGAE